MALIVTPSLSQTHFCKSDNCGISKVIAVHDYFKHAGGRDIFLLDWRQVLSYDV
jgi:hypothetical protein